MTTRKNVLPLPAVLFLAFCPSVAYLTKPFDIDRLVEVTTEVVGMRRAETSEQAVTDVDLA